MLKLDRWCPETLCLDFDLCCTTRLLFYDLNKDKTMYEALGVGTLNKTMGASIPSGCDVGKGKLPIAII